MFFFLGGGWEYLSGRSPKPFWKRIHQICVFQFNISNFMQMWSCPWVHFWFWKRNLHFGKNCLTKFETKQKWTHLHNSGCWMITFLKWSSNFCWHWNCWFFTEGPQKGKLNPLAIWRCDIYIYRIYIYLHTYKYYLHTYTYYIYIFDIGVSESKTSRFGFLIQKGWACLLYCVRGGCWVLWYQWCELCKAVEGHAPCSQPCPNLYM